MVRCDIENKTVTVSPVLVLVALVVILGVWAPVVGAGEATGVGGRE